MQGYDLLGQGTSITFDLRVARLLLADQWGQLHCEAREQDASPKLSATLLLGHVPALLKATNILSKNQSHFNFVCLGFMLTQ
jgi:hypothetical protein